MGLNVARYNTARISKALGVEEDNLKNEMRANRIGGYAKIWKVEDKGKYSVAEMSVSKKHNDGDYVVGVIVNGYDIQFQHKFVRLIGNAHEKMKNVEIPKGGISVQILNLDVTNRYDAEKKTTYTNYTISALDFPFDDNGAQSRQTSGSKPQASNKNELPF